MKRYLLLITIALVFLSSPILSRSPNSVKDNVTLEGRWTGGYCAATAVNGSICYFGSGAYFEIVDFSIPSSPVELGKLELSSLSTISDIFINNNFAYVADGWDGLRIIDISNSANPVEVGSFSSDDLALDVFVAGNYAYLANDLAGLRILDVSNPTNPVEVGHFDTEGNSEGVFVNGNYAYLADGDFGLRILDISNPSSSIEVSVFSTGSYSVNVVVKGSYAYIADGDDLYVLDISNPATPAEAGYLGTGGYFQDVAVEGNYIYLANGSEGLFIADISDLSDINEAGSFNTDGKAVKVAVEGSYIYLADRDSGLCVLKSNITTDFENDISNIPVKYSLSQNYPNPFNPSTTIKYSLAHSLISSQEVKEQSSRLARHLLGGSVLVTLKVYNILGQEVATLVNKQQTPGNYEVKFNAGNLDSGIYFYKLTTDNFSDIKKMILLK